VTFEYEGEHVRIAAIQRVVMVAAPDDTESLARGRAGYWVEVRDTHGRSIYQQVLAKPIQQDYEVFSPDPSERPRHVAATDVRGVFQAVVPDLPDALEVVLYGRPSPDELATRNPRQLVKSRLRESPPPSGAVV